MTGGLEDNMYNLLAEPKQISFESLKLKYENSQNWVLNNVSLTIPAGKTFVLVGASGCGKTSLLRVTAGLLRPKTEKSGFYKKFVNAILREGDECFLEGKILFGDVNVTHTPPRKRHVAMVRQTWDLLPHLTARETLLLPLKLQGFVGNEAEKIVSETLEILELGHEADKRPSELSGGQIQRLAIGRLLVRKDARIHLFDECLSSLDPSLRKQLMQFLKLVLHEQKATSLWVTHLPEEARYMGDLVGVMSKGEIVQLGTYHELEINPNSLLVCKTISGVPDETITDVICEKGVVYVPELKIPLYNINASYEGKAKLVVHPDGWSFNEKGVISAKVIGITPRGLSNFQVYAQIAKDWRIEFISNRLYACGEQIKLSTNPSAARIFYENNGKRIYSHISINEGVHETERSEA